jgi:hypothetical protein
MGKVQRTRRGNGIKLMSTPLRFFTHPVKKYAKRLFS